MRRNLHVLANVLVLAACVSEPRRRPAAMDPSHPDAPEAPPAVPLTAFEAPAPGGGGQAGHGAAAASSAPDAGATLYTCPMHPEVRSDAPGTCPKCGMKLVPEKPAGARAADAGQSGAMPPGHEHGGHGGPP